MTSPLQAIIFDFDGVIADSEPLHLRAFQQALAEEGIALDRAEYFSRYLGYDDVGMFAALARDRALAMSDRHITELVARKGKKLQTMLNGGEVLFPGAAGFIRAAAAAVPIAIASGALRHEIVEIIEGAGLDDLFTTIVASGDTPESKPSPAPYLLAFKQLQQASGCNLDPAAVRGNRGFCVGTRIGTWSRVTLCGCDDELCCGSAHGRRAGRGRAAGTDDPCDWSAYAETPRRRADRSFERSGDGAGACGPGNREHRVSRA